MRKFSYRRYSRAFRHPLRTARGEWVTREGFLLCVQEGDQFGYGEVAPLPEFGTETLAEAGAYLATLVEVRDLSVPEGLPCCAFGFSAALAELKASHRVGARNYDVAGLLPAGVAAEAALLEKLSKGYRVFKWKVGVEAVSKEKAVFERLAGCLPADGRLRLDANGSWTPELLREWLKFLKGWAEFVEFVEQPLAPGLEGAMLSARAESGIEIALDESLNGKKAASWLEAWPGVLVIKAPLMGDLGGLQATLEPLAERVVLSSVFETGIGLSNTLTLADALPKLKLAMGFDTLCFSDALSGRTEAKDLAGIDTEAIWKANYHST